MSDKIEIFKENGNVFLIKNNCQLFVLDKTMNVGNPVKQWIWTEVPFNI